MNQKEAMVIIQALSLAYPSSVKDKTLPMLVGLWQKQFADIPFKQVNEAVIDWISNSEYFPKISQIKEKCLPALEFRNPWYEHFPTSGDFNYNDKDMKWFYDLSEPEQWELEKIRPKELEKRMHYVPDPNDSERNALLKRALELTEKLKKGE